MSWGTKGDNKVSTDLGVVKTTAGKTNEVEVSVPTEDRDINAAYEDAIHVLSTKPPKVESKPDPATQQEDYYRQFRTKCVFFCHFFLLPVAGFAEYGLIAGIHSVLLAWTLSNVCGCGFSYPAWLLTFFSRML